MSKAGSVILLRALWIEPRRRAKPSRISLQEPAKAPAVAFFDKLGRVILNSQMSIVMATLDLSAEETKVPDNHVEPAAFNNKNPFKTPELVIEWDPFLKNLGTF